MRLAELRELPVPPTTVAEGAWDRARRRRRRRALVTVLATAVLVGATGLGVGVARGGDPPPDPAPAHSPAPSPSSPPATPTITDLPDFAALARSVPKLAVTDPTYLSDDPVDRAVLAVTPAWNSEDRSLTIVDVLGDDGRWRYVDVLGLVPTHDEGGYQGSVLTPTGLNADGTMLALPQPDRVVVVDLTTGESRAYDVPGLNNAVIWADESHLVTAVEGRPGGQLLDLRDGSVSDTPLTANTGFAADGSWVTWGRGDIGRPNDPTMVTSDGTRVVPEVRNDGGLQLTSPLVDEEVAVGLGGRDLEQGSQTVYKDVAGVPVVDPGTGDLRAFLYTEGPDTGLVPIYLMALDDDTVTLAAGVAPDYSKLLLLRWNWQTGAVTPVETVAAAMVSGAGE